MSLVKINRGLDLPMAGGPDQAILDADGVGSVALIGDDYVGLQPELLVSEGARVKLGQAVIADRNRPGVNLVAPGGGRVSAIHRGARRILQSLVVELDGDEAETFESWSASEIGSLDRKAVCENLQRSGLWAAFRTRPFGGIPRVDSTPAAIFVTAIDTNPLAADPEVVVAAASGDFVDGVRAIAKLSDGPVYVCTAPGSRIDVPATPGVRLVAFAGPHPAGLVGTHIHYLDPVGPGKTVWYLDYQDAIAVGRLFKTGRLSVERIVSLAGAPVTQPCLLRTRVGASTDDLVRGKLDDDAVRVVSGSVLSGRRAAGWASFLGRYHLQVSVLAEAHDQEFLGWLKPGRGKFSANRIFLSSLRRRALFELTTSQHGSPRAMVPIGSFEKVVPLDVLPTPLLKSLLVRDTATARELGCLELEEEDLALCSYVCCSKYDYGAALRDCLDLLEKSG